MDPSAKLPMTRSIGVAVIGAGMAGRSHANGYRMARSVSDHRLPRVRLVAIADPNRAFAADAADRYGFERHVASWQEVAGDPSIDAVSIVVANDLHREIAVGLLEAAGAGRPAGSCPHAPICRCEGRRLMSMPGACGRVYLRRTRRAVPAASRSWGTRP